jgi:hypothetical protein
MSVIALVAQVAPRLVEPVGSVAPVASLASSSRLVASVVPIVESVARPVAYWVSLGRAAPVAVPHCASRFCRVFVGFCGGADFEDC